MGSIAGNAWRTVVLNTEVTNEVSSAVLSSNALSLPAGTYHVKGIVPINATTGQRLRARIYNLSDAAVLLIGKNARGVNINAGSVIANVSDVFVEGRFTLSGTKSVVLQVYSSIGSSLADAHNIASTPEIYSELFVWKLA